MAKRTEGRGWRGWGAGKHVGRWTVLGFCLPFGGALVLGPLFTLAPVALGLAALRSELPTRSLMIQYAVGVTAWTLIALPFAFTYRQALMVAVVFTAAAVQLLAFGLALLPRRGAPVATV